LGDEGQAQREFQRELITDFFSHKPVVEADQQHRLTPDARQHVQRMEM